MSTIKRIHGTSNVQFYNTEGGRQKDSATYGKTITRVTQRRITNKIPETSVTKVRRPGIRR